MKAGFIGLGTMGGFMAANLQKAIQPLGHTLIVQDLNKNSAAALEANGAQWADSPAALAAESDIIFTSLPGPPEFEHVAFSDTGIHSAPAPRIST